eukprot:jgi/Hompol1/4632/HPOL_003771-RA
MSGARRINVTLEVFKFGLYIMFPIGVLYLYNRPDIAGLFHTSQATNSSADTLHLSEHYGIKTTPLPNTSIACDE